MFAGEIAVDFVNPQSPSVADNPGISTPPDNR